MSAEATHVAHHFDDARQQRDSAELGMWAFLATEVLFFGGFFAAFAVYRYWYPAAFAAAAHELDLWLGAINTGVLLTSSLTVVLAIEAVRRNQRRRAQQMLLATILLGLAFLGIKGYEYAHKFHEHLVPGPHFQPPAEMMQRLEEKTAQSESPPALIEYGTETSARPAAEATYLSTGPLQLFFSLYFGMTGLHALHMIVGIAVMAVMMLLVFVGSVSAQYDTPLEMAGLYWHFVDIVWIFLYPLLYLLH